MSDDVWVATMRGMKQVSLELKLSSKRTCKRESLKEMGKVVPWTVLV